MTQKILKKYFKYDKESGLFIRKITTSSTAIKNTIAGSLNSNGYLRLTIKGKRYLSHRMAWLYVYGVLPEQIDHKNHNRSDNRIDNLRDVGYKENTKNISLRSDNKVGVSGIYFDKKRKSFKVQIKIDGKNIYFGRYKDFKEAISVRDKAYIELGFYENHGK